MPEDTPQPEPAAETPGAESETSGSAHAASYEAVKNAAEAAEAAVAAAVAAMSQQQQPGKDK
jgi:hypothetical protein